ncbi:site-specific integrase [Crocosphaera chwakensis]|uniref:Tn554, transposase B n=1 Tax=Crocosphaera chwakensis CCY0110 TaxID=391612 RepID=A3IZQ0_9CHRO|nr:site-specific integrase [Crocosphaera chwakensis]EAZ88043.1 Tn554, transposase B [Crocosphaera chwakensis CCY0110]
MNKRKHPPISVHPTLHGNLEINWEEDYDGSFRCPKCNSDQLWFFQRTKKSRCKLYARCKDCEKDTYLTCPTGQHIFRYQPGLSCPNPLCKKVGANGITKGWVYIYTEEPETRYKCHYCKVNFLLGKGITGWLSKQQDNQKYKFDFEDDIWYLEYFYDKKKCSQYQSINFLKIEPFWYREKAKSYILFLLKSKRYSSPKSIGTQLTSIRQFGQIINNTTKNIANIKRRDILCFLDAHNQKTPQGLRQKLSALRDFFEWLELDIQKLIHRRDFPKNIVNEPDWLDEKVRIAIKENLNKIPIPIARQYQIQEYTAARPIDVCLMTIDCLVENNGKWYIRFYQNKVDRWHQIPANREIRRIIEEQQKWIKQTIGEDYPYLFCHFRPIIRSTYPEFGAMKPLPEPPSSRSGANPMVKIICILIEKEKILDTNGLKPKFISKITRPSRTQEIRVKHGIKAAQLYADHLSIQTTFQHYAPPTREQIAEVDLPFQELLMNPNNKFLPWQSLPESLLKNPKAHELDLEIAPRLVVYGHCTLDPKTPCPVNLYPKCYGCSSFRPSTGKLPLYERQYHGEQQRLTDAEKAGAELASEEAKATIEAMNKWLPELRRLADG